MVRFARDAAVVLLVVLLLVVLAPPAVTTAAVTVVTAAMTVAGSAAKARTAFRRFPPWTGLRVWWSVAGDHDPIATFMIHPVIAALPALAPGLLVAPPRLPVIDGSPELARRGRLVLLCESQHSRIER